MCDLDEFSAAVVKMFEVIREHVFFRLLRGKGAMKAESCGPLRRE